LQEVFKTGPGRFVGRIHARRISVSGNDEINRSVLEVPALILQSLPLGRHGWVMIEVG
jgi:hypothetical protein